MQYKKKSIIFKKAIYEVINIKENLINARELQKRIRNKSRFLDWIKIHIGINNLKENEDYYIRKKETNFINETEYFLTEDASKKIVLSQVRNEITKTIKEELIKGKDLEEAFQNAKKKRDVEINIIKYEDEKYPEQLRKIKNPPKQIYVKGNVEILKEFGIAVIGTRNCTMYGRRICKIFSRNLTGYNLNIISGLARGIDTCAHKECIKANGKTIAVLPSGFNKVFPNENEDLLDEILKKGGTIVTEYPPDFEKTSDSCRERNRIIAGLAIGTLVIEAGKYSGTSITVRNTNEQGKKAFCIPSSLLSSKGIGTNRMIKNGEAKLVTEVEDIMKEFPKIKPKPDFDFKRIEYNKIKKKNTKITNFEIEEENLEIYNCLSRNPTTIEEIAQTLNKPIKEISYKLTLLELQGAIEELPGKKFKIK